LATDGTEWVNRGNDIEQSRRGDLLIERMESGTEGIGLVNRRNQIGKSVPDNSSCSQIESARNLTGNGADSSSKTRRWQISLSFVMFAERGRERVRPDLIGNFRYRRLERIQKKCPCADRILDTVDQGWQWHWFPFRCPWVLVWR
jgi:hypothetical protein